jgi:hypothetical protein
MKSRMMGSGSKSKSGHKSKNNSRNSTLQALVDSVYDLKPYIDRSSNGALKAMRRLEKATEQLEVQLEDWKADAIVETPRSTLKVKYTLFVDEKTPELEPYPGVTLGRATYQANDPSEDRSLTVIGEDFIFAGVFDGHGGTSAADYAQANVFPRFQKSYEKGASVKEAFVQAFVSVSSNVTYLFL